MSDWKKTCEFAERVHAVSHDQLTRVQNGEELTQEDNDTLDKLLKESEEMKKAYEE